MTKQYSIDEQIAEVRRELVMRRHLYPQFIERGKLTQRHASERISCLEAVLDTLEQARDHQTPGLFEP